jgi:hypothetical protein
VVFEVCNMVCIVLLVPLWKQMGGHVVMTDTLLMDLWTPFSLHQQSWAYELATAVNTTF